MLKDEYKIYEDKMQKSIDSVAADFAAVRAGRANAAVLDRITFAEVLERRLTVMDLTATALAQDQKLKVLLFALEDPENILRAVRGEDVGTLFEASRISDFDFDAYMHELTPTGERRAE